MDLVCSLAGIVNPAIPRQGIRDLSNAGFENVFLDMGIVCGAGELERFGKPKSPGWGPLDRAAVTEGTAKGKPVKENGCPDEKETVAENPSMLGSCFEKLFVQCQENRLSIPIARAPYLYRDTKRADLNGLLTRIVWESIRYCGRVGCPKLIVRPLFSGISHGKEWEMNQEYYLRLTDLARENQVMILLENQCRAFNGHMVRGICSDGRTAADWVDRLNEAAGEERFGFSMDVGVCNLCGQDMHEFVGELGDRIKAVLLRDCDGHQENSLLPFTCVGAGQPQTDWLGLIRGLRRIRFDGPLILDASATIGAFSPLLRPQVLTLAKMTVGYLKWQVEMESLLKKYASIVLFGAGNMCRNYMKCYGQTYPPLFTCDNNPQLWGTSFCGLEVRPPEVLKELPEDCVVLICNIYYRDIESQLRKMGIQNIAFFNDEYMPSFPFDRLKEV
ncbi:MAG: hypothetical protein HFG54_07930 [Lachnospiraceae bacterium]|nr:hypothetical protein [Lachnospiraceae bacterium]